MIKKLKKRNKKAAMEMSVGTIVTIVLLMSVMILGLVFVRKIMCSGITLTEQIDTKVENEIRDLFGTDKFGVECMGEGGQVVKFGDGGTRQFICIINVKEAADYEIKLIDITSLSGVEKIEAWKLDWDYEGTVAAGEPKTVVPLILKIPDNVDETELKIEFDVWRDDVPGSTITSYVTVTPVGGFSAAIC